MYILISLQYKTVKGKMRSNLNSDNFEGSNYSSYFLYVLYLTMAHFGRNLQ